MVKISDIRLVTNSIFDLTDDLSLIENITGINFTDPDGILFESKEAYLKNATEASKITTMFEFAEETNDNDLKKFLDTKFANKMALFFNE